MNVLKNPKVGDIFYTEIKKKFFFMQIINITINLPESNNSQKFKYGFFIVVFEKAFLKLPKTISELNLSKIYKIRYRPKKSILYVSHWSEKLEIELKKDRIDYEKHSKYQLHYFGNAHVVKDFEPKIIKDFTIPSQYKTNDEGIDISHSPSDINWIFSRILQDEEKQFEKRKNIVAKYFNEWIEYVESDAIIKTEKIISNFESECKIKDVSKGLKKCIIAINKLDEKFNFITTIEAEHLFDKLVEIATKFGLNDLECEEIIDKYREF